MDATVAAVIVVGILALVVLVGVVRSRGWFRGQVHGPGGSKASVEGGPPSGVRARRIKAGRDMAARGPSVDARGVEAGQDVTLDANPPEEGHPKA
ncbi:MAG: hypothetical protein ACRD12_04235 [Acidimicrobiales bacterium]